MKIHVHALIQARPAVQLKRALALALVFLIFGTGVAAAWPASTVLSWYALGASFGSARSGHAVVTSAVGQALVGTSGQLDTRVKSGFLADSLLKSAPVSVQEDIHPPRAFELYPNYPNPFNAATTIRYTLPVAAHVTLKIYNVLGQALAMLVDEKQQAGEQQVTWDAGRFPSGVYLYRLTVEDLVETRKLLLLK